MGQRRSTLKLAFLDSSVLFTAVNSPTGGSSKLFTLKNLELCTSTFVLTEVERNVRSKLEFYHLKRFILLVEKLTIFNKVPTKSQITKAKQSIHAKDAPVIVSAKIHKPHLLFTLDQKHFLTEEVKEFLKPIIVLTPKMFFAKSKI